ncbi:MAG: putative glycolipid-binding domain-containing protein [Acidimicrobiales bacterium]|nr:putative glycolipid-binding domain-containing protein [Acidimicrobiales bacterium]
MHRVVRWSGWGGTTVETLTLRDEGAGITADGRITPTDDPATTLVHWAMRLDRGWRVRHLLVFTSDDGDQPDLWLAHDGEGSWRHVHGADRPDLAGCLDVDLTCTPFTETPLARRLDLGVGDHAELAVVHVDAVALEASPGRRRLTRLAPSRWRHQNLATGWAVDVDVDDDGLVLDEGGVSRRLADPAG